MTSDRPIFILGCPRSGTTLLALMVHAHPRLAMPPESRFLISTWRDRAKFGDLSTRAQRRQLASSIAFYGSKVRTMGLRRRDVRRMVMKGPPTVGSALGLVFQEYARANGKQRWGDKRPMYYQEVDVLLRLFPDAQFVQIVRDARATVASLKDMPWWDFGFVGATAAWGFAEKCMRRNQSRLPADTFHTMRYESLVDDPRGELTRLCEFLDEDFDEAMLEPHRLSDDRANKAQWHQGLNKPVSNVSGEAWRTRLSPQELGLVEAVLARPMRRQGYEPCGEGARPSPLLLARYLRQTAHFQLSTRQRWLAEARDARRSHQPVAAVLTSRQRALAREEGGRLGVLAARS